MMQVLDALFGIGVIIGGPIALLISILASCAFISHIVRGTISEWWLILFIPGFLAGLIIFRLWFDLADFIVNPPPDGC